MKSFVLALLMLTGVSLGQTIYQPFEYEYQAGGTIYFYDGEQPAVHAAAAETSTPGGTFGRHGGFDFAAADVSVGREVESTRVRLFSDRFRSGLQDASIAGMTVSDIRNSALSQVPRYFRKSDLLRSAATVDGVRLVSARSSGIRVYTSDGTPIFHAPARPLMILPKPADPCPAAKSIAASVGLD